MMMYIWAMLRCKNLIQTQNHEESDYGHDLEVAIILHEFHVLLTMSSGCKVESVHLRLCYLSDGSKESRVE